MRVAIAARGGVEMEQTIRDWLNWLRTAGKSPTTVIAYGWEMRGLVKRWPMRGALQFTRNDLTTYLGERRLNGAGECAVKRGVAAFRSFFGWCCGKKSPALGVPFPKVKLRRQRTPSPADLLSVLAICNGSARGVRDRAVLLLALDTGLRESELCRLRVSDVEMDRRRLVVRVKGGDDGEAVFSGETRSALVEWLVVRGDRAVPEMFVSVGGKRPGSAVTPSGLRVMFRYMGVRAGLQGGFSPHDMRRAFATMAHRLGAPSRLVQVAGRWDDLRMVERYTASLSAEDFDPYSPVRGLLG